MTATQLEPSKRELGLFPKFIARQCETLAIREKVASLSGDSFEIKLANGESFLRVEGRVISSRKSVYDMSNTHIFDIAKERLHLHTTYAIKTPEGEKIAEIKSGFKLIGTKDTITFNSTDGQPATLTMTGGFLGYDADIVDEDTKALVARVDRKVFSGRDILFGQQTYALSVAANVDMALMAALCICMDEKDDQ